MAGQALTENIYSSGLAYENPANSKRVKRRQIQLARGAWWLILRSCQPIQSQMVGCLMNGVLGRTWREANLVH